jgi:hypothetical protein
MWWSALIGPISGALSKWQEQRGEVKAARHTATIARIEAGESSWKDEYLVIIWSYPVISGFIPGLQDSTMAGFTFMAGLPPWYVGGWVTISLSVFGLTKIMDIKRK